MKDHLLLQARSLTLPTGHVNSARKNILDNVSVELGRGEFHVLLGPNGSGKSSLIRTLAGVEKNYSGEIFFSGRNISAYSASELARKRAVLSQENEISFPIAVRELIAMGRMPYAGLKLRQQDEDLVDKVIALMDLKGMENILYTNLSGGEKKRVQIARILCQDTELFYFDEPLNSLDIKYQLAVLKILSSLCEQGKTVVCAIHDLNLALEHASHLSLLKEGKLCFQGAVSELDNKGVFEEVFEVKMNMEKRGEAFHFMVIAD